MNRSIFQCWKLKKLNSKRYLNLCISNIPNFTYKERLNMEDNLIIYFVGPIKVSISG